jgi:hypothetical protein
MSAQVVKDERSSHYGSRIIPSTAYQTVHLPCSRKEPNGHYRRIQERHSDYELYPDGEPDSAYKKVLNEVLTCQLGRDLYLKERADLVQVRLRDSIHFEWRRRGVIHGRIRFQVWDEILIPDQREICSLALYRVNSY